jgi:hypothetical protein
MKNSTKIMFWLGAYIGAQWQSFKQEKDGGRVNGRPGT